MDALIGIGTVLIALVFLVQLLIAIAIILLIVVLELIAAICSVILNLFGCSEGEEGRLIAQACVYATSRSGSVQHKATEYHNLTQRVVKLFKTQRQEKHQFAVLFLSSQDYIADVAFQTKTGPVYSPEEATDSSKPIFPLDRDLHNFVTARPHRKWYACRKRHAEEQLLDKFDLLKTSFESSRFNRCRTVVLFTWILPCKKCTTQIINKLGGRGHKVIVIYIIKHIKNTARDELYTVKRLEKAKIDVMSECYDHRVLPL